MWTIIVVTGAALLLVACAVYVNAATQAVLRRRPIEQDCPPDRFGLAYEEVTFPAADGLTLRGWFIPAERSTARGTIVFCHGQAGSMDRDTD